MFSVTIIIPTLLEDSYLQRCIYSIYKYCNIPVHIHLSLGYNNFSVACNEAAKRVRDEWILFLNDDIEAENNFLFLMFDTALNLGADIVGAKLLYPDGRIQHVGVYFKEDGTPYHAALGAPDKLREDRIVPAVTGACMMVKRGVFEALGGFDEEFENGFEDVDFCLRAREAGYRIALCGRTKLIHYEKCTRGFDRDRFLRNLDRLKKKWFSKIKNLR